MICFKCNMKLKFGLTCHWHCHHSKCTFVCHKSHDDPADGGFCGPLTCGTYHQHCSRKDCDKLLDEEDEEETHDLCSLCKETEEAKETEDKVS